MKLPKWYINRYHRKCLMEITDMATGVSERGTPVTAFRWTCKLCGRVIDDICESGFRQIAEGHKQEDVFKWFIKRSDPDVPLVR